jgi:hypothetical protein
MRRRKPVLFGEMGVCCLPLKETSWFEIVDRIDIDA